MKMSSAKPFRLAICLAATFLCASLSQADVDIRHDATVDAVKAVMPCVVNIRTESLVQINDPFQELFRQFYGPRYEVQSSLGSGVIIDEEGYLLTNLHVVNRARRIQIKLSEEAGGEEYEVQLVNANSTVDVALLKIISDPKNKGRKFRAVKLAKDDDLLLGETILALGNPFGLGGSVSRGILSSKTRAVPKEGEELGVSNWLQTDASINPGNSGGPIINMRGELIGLSEAMLPGAQGIGFAIPVKDVREALSSVFIPETNNRWFGARVRPDSAPLLVESVDAGSPAAKAGLKVGDAILQVDDKTPKAFEFNRWLRDDQSLKVKLTVQRGEQQIPLNVQMVSFSDMLRQRLGVDVQELSEPLAKQYGLQSHTGLLIAGIDKTGPAEAAALRPNYLITGIDRQQTGHLSEAVMAIYDRKRGETVALSVLVPQTQGEVIVGYRQGVTQLKLR